MRLKHGKKPLVGFIKGTLERDIVYVTYEEIDYWASMLSYCIILEEGKEKIKG